MNNSGTGQNKKAGHYFLGGIIVNHAKQHESLYDVIAPLLTAGLTLLISLYVCLWQPDVYAYLLPVFVVFLLASIRFFNRSHKAFCKEEKSDGAASFYKGCMFIYFVFSLYLLSISFVFFTVYTDGGYLVVWSCIPLSLLCLTACMQAEKGLRGAQTSSKPVDPDVI